MARTDLTRSAPETGEVERRRWMFRHPLVIRITHWVNAVCLLVLLMTKQSGDGENRKDSGGQQASEDTVASGGSPVRFYESIDLVDAFHPQTILAYDMNGQVLPVSNGAPLPLRLERNLGYKQTKYVMRIEVVESFAHFGEGKGGYWEDQGYACYAGI